QAQAVGKTPDQLQLQLVEILESSGSVVVDIAPGLEGTLVLEDYVGLLDGGLIDVEGIPKEVLNLRTHVGGARHPLLPDLLLEGQGPLLLPRVPVVSRRLVD